MKRASPLVLVALLACARPSPSAAGGNPIAPLITAVAIDRSRLDSVIAQIHAISGDTSSASLTRFDRLRVRADALDSQYRDHVARLLAEIGARTAGVSAATKYPAINTEYPFVRAFADGANWMLQASLIYQVGPNRTDVVIVPRGFITDFASVPQPLRAIRDLMPSSSRYGIPALVHDYLYWRQDCTREQADDIMKLALKQAGVTVLERNIVHQGLRGLGQSAWETNAKAHQSGMMRTVGPPYDQIPLTSTWTEYRSWLYSVGAKPGVEYPIPQSVCRAGAAS